MFLAEMARHFDRADLAKYPCRSISATIIIKVMLQKRNPKAVENLTWLDNNFYRE